MPPVLLAALGVVSLVLVLIAELLLVALYSPLLGFLE
jgi:hypothetical protein